MSRITEELREAMHYTNGYSFALDFSFEECCDRVDASFDQLQSENAKLRELATYALKHIVEVLCEGKRDLYRGKPCEDCVDAGSSDCPKCMPRMFDVSGIEVDE